jgi:hypothetical protein
MMTEDYGATWVKLFNPTAALGYAKPLPPATHLPALRSRGPSYLIFKPLIANVID